MTVIMVNFCGSPELRSGQYCANEQDDCFVLFDYTGWWRVDKSMVQKVMCN